MMVGPPCLAHWDLHSPAAVPAVHTEAILALHRLCWGLCTQKLGAPKNPHRLLCPAALVANGADGQDERQER